MHQVAQKAIISLVSLSQNHVITSKYKMCVYNVYVREVIRLILSSKCKQTRGGKESTIIVFVLFKKSTFVNTRQIICIKDSGYHGGVTRGRAWVG